MAWNLSTLLPCWWQNGALSSIKSQESVGEKESWLINLKIVTGCHLKLHGTEYCAAERKRPDQGTWWVWCWPQGDWGDPWGHRYCGNRELKNKSQTKAWAGIVVTTWLVEIEHQGDRGLKGSSTLISRGGFWMVLSREKIIVSFLRPKAICQQQAP